jgi:hypothetical protein
MAATLVFIPQFEEYACGMTLVVLMFILSLMKIVSLEVI